MEFQFPDLVIDISTAGCLRKPSGLVANLSDLWMQVRTPSDLCGFGHSNPMVDYF